MNATSEVAAADLELSEVGRALWEACLPHLTAVAAGDEAPFLSSLEGAARGAGLAQSIPVTALLDAFTDGSVQVRGTILAAGGTGAETAARSLLAVEHVALTRIASGYSSGLEETITQLRHVAEESSPLDPDTGAIKPGELGERLSLEVERCQRMDLSLGLLELAIGAGEARPAPTHTDRHGDRQGDLHEIGECLRDNLRRYDSIGLTSDGAFLLVLPDISRRGLAGAAERLRRELGACAGQSRPPALVFALAHYDFVDVNATEMLEGLRHSMQEARGANQPMAWA